MKTTVTMRDVGDVKIVELHGKITIGAGDLQMREAIHAAVNGGATKLLVDMKDVTTIDSSGVGELVGCYTTATHKGAKLKLVNLPPEDQRRPHGDAAHHRVRRLHEREGRARELLMVPGGAASVLRPVSDVAAPPASLRSFASSRRGARPRSTRAFRPSSRRTRRRPRSAATASRPPPAKRFSRRGSA